MVPVMANPTRNGQLRLNSLLKKTGHGSNFLILYMRNRSAAVSDDRTFFAMRSGKNVRLCGNVSINRMGYGLNFSDTFGLNVCSPRPICILYFYFS